MISSFFKSPIDGDTKTSYTICRYCCKKAKFQYRVLNGFYASKKTVLKEILYKCAYYKRFLFIHPWPYFSSFLLHIKVTDKFCWPTFRISTTGQMLCMCLSGRSRGVYVIVYKIKFKKHSNCMLKTFFFLTIVVNIYAIYNYKCEIKIITKYACFENEKLVQ